MVSTCRIKYAPTVQSGLDFYITTQYAHFHLWLSFTLQEKEGWTLKCPATEGTCGRPRHCDSRKGWDQAAARTRHVALTNAAEAQRDDWTERRETSAHASSVERRPPAAAQRWTQWIVFAAESLLQDEIIFNCIKETFWALCMWSMVSKLIAYSELILYSMLCDKLSIYNINHVSLTAQHNPNLDLIVHVQ